MTFSRIPELEVGARDIVIIATLPVCIEPYPAIISAFAVDGLMVAVFSDRRMPRDAIYFAGTIAMASTSTIMPGQASWLTLTNVWAGRAAFPKASALHFVTSPTDRASVT